MLLLLLALLPSSLAAQTPEKRARAQPALYWGVNVSTAAASSFLQGRAARVPVLRALAGGVVGGVVGGSGMYLGQRLVGTGRPGLRFLGLQTVATGASVARNLGAGNGPFSELTFPVFPFYVQVHPRAGFPVSVRVSALALAGAIHTAREFDALPDFRESLLAGTPVFAIPAARLSGCENYTLRIGCSEMLGHHVLGAIVFSTSPKRLSARNVLTHELGHVAQDVRDVVLDAVPASDAVLRTTAVGRFVARFLVVDAFMPLNLVSRAAGPPRDPACTSVSTYYECETEAMMGGVR